MLIFTLRFAQLAAVVCKMDVSCINTQQPVYYRVDVPSSVSKSGLKSLSRLRSLPYASRLEHGAFGRGVCIYAYLGGTRSIYKMTPPSLWVGRAGGVASGCGDRSLVGCLSQAGGGVPAPLCLQRVWGFCAVAFGQRKQPSIWCSRTIARCLFIAVITCLCPAPSTPRLLPSRTLAGGFSIRYWVYYIAVREIPPLAILAIFKARRMSDCSSCTQPPFLAIVADMWKSYKKIVPASTDEIRLLPQPYTFPYDPLRWVNHVPSTLGDASHLIWDQKTHSHQLDDVWLCALCR